MIQFHNYYIYIWIMNDFILEWSPDEKIISFGSIGIHWYSLMFLLAFFIGFQIMKKIPEVKGKEIKNEYQKSKY